jgi:hypothetical protein
MVNKGFWISDCRFWIGIGNWGFSLAQAFYAWGGFDIKYFILFPSGPFRGRDRNHGTRLPSIVFIGQVKGATSHRVNEGLKPNFKLQWQEGYGVLTLRKDELDKVSHYIDNQETHHSMRRLSVLLERTESDVADQPPEGG